MISQLAPIATLTIKLLENSLGYKGNILIVDDEPANLEYLFSMLTKQQYEVRIAKSGKRALAAIEISIPDLILLDIKMPDMDGYEVCRRLKAKSTTQDIPVIFVSANDNPIDKVQAFSLGAADYITKPFHFEEVLARIESRMRIAQLSQQLHLQMLRYQLNPHFLFNALISTRVLVYEDQETAATVLTKLSEYLHYLLSNNGVFVSLEEEIKAAKHYLDIEKIRFKDKLSVNISINSENKDVSVPALILQPLLENAMKYGMKTSPKPLKIELSIYIKGDLLNLSVSNSGQWVTKKENNIPEADSLGIGLRNIRWRLNQLYPSHNCLSFKEENQKVTVLIQIPLC
jgi:DNA-binding response OmpR family regulator